MTHDADRPRDAKSQHPDVVVVYLLRTHDGRDEVLLGAKRRGLGTGNLVAPGGKREPAERAVDAAVREVAEEVGLEVRVDDLEHRGTLDYRFPFRPAWTQRSDVFVCRRWAGDVRKSDELEADWIPIDDVPYERMWDDARLWLPGVLAGGSVEARCTFAEDNAHVAGFAGTGIG